MKIINAFFVSVLLFTISIFAQSKNILADGNPPLTQTMVNRLTTLMQWSLNADFSAEERSQMRSVLINYWRKGDEKSIKATVDMLAFEEKIASANDSQKQNLQPQIEQKLLEEFEKDADEPFNKLLFAVYKRNHSPNNSAEKANSFAELVGRWQVSHANSMTTQNVYTGALGDVNGMIAEYDIKTNGSVIFSFFLSQNNHGCVTKLKTSKTGRISVNGSRANFVYDKGTTTSTDNCNAKNNYTKNLGKTSENLDFTIKHENGKKQFCFVNGQLKDCAVKIN